MRTATAHRAPRQYQYRATVRDLVKQIERDRHTQRTVSREDWGRERAEQLAYLNDLQQRIDRNERSIDELQRRAHRPR